MNKIVRIAAGMFLIAHGAAHLMATSVYWKLSTSTDLAYQTTIFNGALDLGDTGIWIFGLLWLLAGLGTVHGGLLLIVGSRYARPVLLAATVLSLLVCLPVLEQAKIGVVIDVIVLGGLLLSLSQAVRSAQERSEDGLRRAV